MHPNTGEIKEVPDGEMAEIEKAFNVQVNKIRKDAAEGKEGARQVAKVLGLKSDPAVPPIMVPIPSDQIKKVRKMNKERRKAWAKSELDRRVKRKRQRKARKAGRKGKSR